MKGEELKRLAIEKALLLVDEPPENWKTFNDKLNTFILKDREQVRSKIEFNKEEEPILECVLIDSFFIVTTERIVSMLSDKYYELQLKDFSGFGNDHEQENNRLTNGRLPKTNLIVVRYSGGEIYFKIDSYYPAHFAKVLIQNLSVYLQTGTWFWDPKPKAK